MPYSDPNLLKYIRENLESGKYYYVEHTDYEKTLIYNEVDRSLVESIVFSNEAIAEYEYFWLKKWEIDLNLGDYFETIKHYEQKVNEFRTNKEILTFDREEIFINVNRKFISYISSCRIFIDHMETKLKGKYGDKSIEYKQFDKAKRYCYDTFFSYRFFNHLRNYVIHKDYPITQIGLSGIEINNGQVKPGSHTLTIEFDHTKLSTDETIQKKLTNDFKYRNKFFLVKPQIEEYLKVINYINKTLLVIERDYYLKNSAVIESFNKVQNQGGLPEITQFTIDLIKNTVAFATTPIRLDLIYKIQSALLAIE